MELMGIISRKMVKKHPGQKDSHGVLENDHMATHDLNQFEMPVLRAFCKQKGIVWRRGAGAIGMFPQNKEEVIDMILAHCMKNSAKNPAKHLKKVIRCQLGYFDEAKWSEALVEHRELAAEKRLTDVCVALKELQQKYPHLSKPQHRPAGRSMPPPPPPPKCSHCGK